MKSKTLIGLASLLLCVGMASACGEQPAPTTSTEPTTTQPSVEKFTVRFLVDGNPIKTIEVEKGQKAVYDGETPVKAADAEAPKYEFMGWDRDLETPITANTDINATFEGYAFGYLIDNFEAYNSKGDITDAGWVFETYPASAWQVDSDAKVMVGRYATEGEKSLSLNLKRDGAAHRATKTFDGTTFVKRTNAFKISLLACKEYKSVAVSFTVPVEVEGEMKEAPFKYVLAKADARLSSEDYVSYVIPFGDENWDVWGNAGTVYDFANYYNVDGHFIAKYATKVSVTLTADQTGYKYNQCYIDDIGFTTVEDESFETAEIVHEYDRYTASIMGGAATVRIDLGENNTATATASNDKDHPIPGTITRDGSDITFSSNDNGQTLVYNGKMMSSNRMIKYVSATGTLAAAVENADFYAVQVVENFEQYDYSAGQGTTWHDANTKEDREGFRGNYYMEYRNEGFSTTSPWGSDKTKLIGGGGAQLNLYKDATNANKAYRGDQFASMKSSKDHIMRFMTWGLLDGTADSNGIFRGAYLSFWFKSDVKLSNFKVRFYYITNPSGASMGSDCNAGSQKQFNYASGAVAEWTHCVVQLDPLRTYSGFNFQLANNGTADGKFYIDDIEVFAVNPYMDTPKTPDA